MTLAQQLDNVLALIRGMPCRCMSIAQLGERDPGCDRCQIAEKLSAIRAAVGGEAVAWQCRAKWADGSVGDWSPCSQRFAETKHDIDYEYRALYAPPPTTVDVGAVRKLVEKWRGITTNTDIEYGSRVFIEGYDKALNYCADELAALIGEKAR